MKPLNLLPSLVWLFPAVACAIGYINIYNNFHHPIQFDAEHVYLVAARAFLDQGWSYLLTSDSYRVVPLAYLWPALWGADPAAIRIANAGLLTGVIFFLWQTGCYLGGKNAGIASIFLFILHPELPHYFYTELTEPIFLFGLFGFLHQLARVLIHQKITSTSLWIGSCMLCITLLSRPILQILAPATLLLCITLIKYPKKLNFIEKHQPTLIHLSWILLFSFALPFALILKNGLLFGLWGLGTGSGTGLYLGTHPLFQGAEPPFLGLGYDNSDLIGSLTRSDNHLSIVSDRISRTAALMQLSDMSWSESIAFHLRKIWWWLMHHPAQMISEHGNLRKFRIFEFVVIAFAALCLYKKKNFYFNGENKNTNFFIIALLAAFAATLLQLTPILYNTRYSSALLDPWLILLTAFGISHLTQGFSCIIRIKQKYWLFGLRHTQSVSKFLIGAACMALIFALVYNLSRKYEYRAAIDPEQMGSTQTILNINSDDRINITGMKNYGLHTWKTTEPRSEFKVFISSEEASTVKERNIFNAIWLSKISVQVQESEKCGKLEVAYQLNSGVIRPPLIKMPLLTLESSAAPQLLATHANFEMRPEESGSYRLVFHCPPGTVISWHGTRLLESRHVHEMADRMSHLKSSSPVMP
ncbi:hypothetical protein [Comamonas serinivorans]|uniref:hypothetical protein n=1 Tax=Comamonas serinivorans TaxID=1082851 RepID=UPI0012F8D7E4|nr:hypothetical protein [Comamonas serinivorans]